MDKEQVNWFKVEVNMHPEGYAYVGSSFLSLEALISKLSSGEYIRLDNLLYMDRGIVKEWAEWDKSVIPTAYINPYYVTNVMQFIRDPRLVER